MNSSNRKRNREDGGQSSSTTTASAPVALHTRGNMNTSGSSSASAVETVACGASHPLTATRSKGPSARSSVASANSRTSSSAASVRSGATRTAARPGWGCGGGAMDRPNGRKGPAPSSTPSTAVQCKDGGKARLPAAQAEEEGNPDPEQALWAVKRDLLEKELQQLTYTHQRLRTDKETVLDAMEAMLCEHEVTKERIHQASLSATAQHAANMKALEMKEDACLAKKQRALAEAARLRARVEELAGLKEAVQEGIVLETERTEELERTLSAAKEAVRAQQDKLALMKQEEVNMQDASYGLSGEVKDMVMAMEKLQQQKRQAEVAAMETEIVRRELYSKCEELKGSIRVFCRVKGSGKPGSPPPTEKEREDNEDVRTPADADLEESSCSKTDPSSPATPCPALVGEPASLPTPALSPSHNNSLAAPLRASTASTASTSTSAFPAMCRISSSSNNNNKRRRQKGHGGGSLTPQSSLFPSSNGSGDAVNGEESEAGCADEIYSFPDGANGKRKKSRAGGERDVQAEEEEGEDSDDEDAFALPRTINVHQSRQNATSTGKQSTTDTFSFDYVFDHHATQSEVFTEVEPLVNSAIDGYRVCVFAYGQTGSGKTYTMEGSLAAEESYGIIPRSLATIFARQEALSKEGWSYTLSCSLIEIYNDVIRDLQQNPNIYESNNHNNNHNNGNGGASSASSASYHTIKHQGENTSVTNVKSTTLTSMNDFRRVYKLATQHRRTARTQLNERSSRSHCVFILNIDGVNSTIRRRSAGALCLVDLAGSERVNDSGAQGQQFKEAVNINKSLLDLGKCIHAMRGGTVAPWRNCKLTYLLQNYLGSKGGKTLMLVNVSDRRQHLPESLNSLRFATRVSETVVGQSVKRVTNY